MEKNQEPKHHTKAQLVLDGSDKYTFGIVRDTEGIFTWETGKGSAVGEWTKSPHDDMYHLFLLTSIEALVDKSVVRLEKIAVQRAAGVIRSTGEVEKLKSTKRAPTHLKATVMPEPPPISIDFSSMKSKLRGSA